ncbi:unnamed protein product [Diatraea saccharalis]|uniref:Uncharacterized protein n=1 Tax=Diatraea saccharalis TaxID=40085 RepID=A0A9N9RF26_9NEOP|nr:unnamed protein product [Diatraea saccharalis]
MELKQHLIDLSAQIRDIRVETGLRPRPFPLLTEPFAGGRGGERRTQGQQQPQQLQQFTKSRGQRRRSKKRTRRKQPQGNARSENRPPPPPPSSNQLPPPSRPRSAAYNRITESTSCVQRQLSRPPPLQLSQVKWTMSLVVLSIHLYPIWVAPVRRGILKSIDFAVCIREDSVIAPPFRGRSHFGCGCGAGGREVGSSWPPPAGSGPRSRTTYGITSVAGGGSVEPFLCQYVVQARVRPHTPTRRTDPPPTTNNDAPSRGSREAYHPPMLRESRRPRPPLPGIRPGRRSSLRSAPPLPDLLPGRRRGTTS